MFCCSYRLAGLLFIGAVLLGPVATAPGQGTLVALTTRRQMVFDHAGKYLYITTSDGFVRPYNLATHQLETAFSVGGSPNGLDIAPDDSFLLVAQGNLMNAQGVCHKIDLRTRAISAFTYAPDSGEAGMIDVKITSKGHAFATTWYNGTGFTRVRQIDLQSGVMTQRHDTPQSWVYGDTDIYRSADHSRLYFVEAETSNGEVFTYDAANDSFSPEGDANYYLSISGMAVSPDGKLVASSFAGYAALDRASDFTFVGSINNSDGGLAFDGRLPILYTVQSALGEIVATDYTTLVEKFRLTIGELMTFGPGGSPLGAKPFGAGVLTSSPDGRYLALSTPSGIRIFSPPASPPPPRVHAPSLEAGTGMVFDHAGRYLYVSTWDGWIERYDLNTQRVEDFCQPGGVLAGIDILPDDSALFIAQANGGVARGMIHRVDIATRAITNLNFTHDPESAESGAWDVGIGASDVGFFTTEFAGSGGTRLRQLDARSGAMVVREDVPLNFVRQDTEIRVSGDGGTFFFLQSNSGGGPVLTFDVATSTFGPQIDTGAFTGFGNGAINRDGTLLAVGRDGYWAIDTFPDPRYLRSFSGFDSGMCFDRNSDVLYLVDTSADEVVAYNTTDYSERFRFSIGEDIPPGVSRFGSGGVISSPDGGHLALHTPSTIRVYSIPPASSLPPLPLTLQSPRDFVFNHAGDHLYITTADGFVWPYNLRDGIMETAFNVGGSLTTIDMSADDSFLLIGQEHRGLSTGAIHKLDPRTGQISLYHYNREFYEEGVSNLAIAANGSTLFSTSLPPHWSGSNPLRQLDLTSGQVIKPMIGQNIIFVSADTQIRHSTDKSRLFLVEPGISSGATFTYTAATNTFGVERDENGFLGNGTAAVNRDGTLVALAAGATIDLETAPDLNVIHNFAGGSGVAFSATEDTLFILDQTFSEVVAFDTSNFAERYRFSTGDKVTGEAPNRLGLGNFGSSPDGRYLALITPTAVRLYDTSNPAAPTPSPIPVTTPTPPPTPTPWPTPNPTPTPAPKPVVTVTVSPSQVSEGDVAFFTVTASPQSSRPVDIFYTMSGKAVSGGDYSLNNDPNSPGRATIPLGQDSVTISFTAIVDQAKEKSETATMTLSSSAGYDFPNTGGTGGKKKKKKAPTAPQATVTISANK